MTISRAMTINFDFITPEELAKEFCKMSEDEQAVFFNKIHEETQNWVRSFGVQLSAISSSRFLTFEGREIMREIGKFAFPVI